MTNTRRVNAFLATIIFAVGAVTLAALLLTTAEAADVNGNVNITDDPQQFPGMLLGRIQRLLVIQPHLHLLELETR